MVVVPAQAVRDLKAAVHGLDSLIGRRGYGCLFPGPLRFKSGTIGQPARRIPPPEFLLTKTSRRVLGCGGGAAASNCDQGADFGERAENIALGERRRRAVRPAGIGVRINPLPDAAQGRGGGLVDCDQIGPGVGPGSGIFQAAIGVVAPALKNGHRGIGAARVDVPNIGLGDGVRGSQHVTPAPTERLPVGGEVAERSNHVAGRAGEIGVPVARGVE